MITKNLSNLLYSIIFIGFFLPAALAFTGKIDDGIIEKSKVSYINGSPKQMILTSIPRKTKSYNFEGREFFCHQGNFFMLEDKKYIQIFPPSGLEVKEMTDYERIIKGGQVVYFLNGIFYYKKPKQKEFIVTYGPIGSQIYKLPKNAEKVKIEGEEFYAYYKAVFKATPTRSRDMYTLVGYIGD
ncbi:MAG: hypothetical protein JEZ09_09360 [Salinivirgaceae bacterium]|nr:hypothetical protein [Salinivirgaceae bacterium]